MMDLNKTNTNIPKLSKTYEIPEDKPTKFLLKTVTLLVFV